MLIKNRETRVMKNGSDIEWDFSNYTNRATQLLPFANIQKREISQTSSFKINGVSAKMIMSFHSSYSATHTIPTSHVTKKEDEVYARQNLCMRSKTQEGF